MRDDLIKVLLCISTSLYMDVIDVSCPHAVDICLHIINLALACFMQDIAELSSYSKAT
jgi:hypothetical protein